MPPPAHDPHVNLDRFDALFDDDTLAAELASDDRLTQRLVGIVELGLDVVEELILTGDTATQLGALQKILPLATKVADKRQDAMYARIVEVAREMLMEVFPDRQAIEDAYADRFAQDPPDDATPVP